MLFDLREAVFRNKEICNCKEARVVIGEIAERSDVETQAIGDEKIEVGNGVPVFIVRGGVELENGGAEIIVGL